MANWFLSISNILVIKPQLKSSDNQSIIYVYNDIKSAFIAPFLPTKITLKYIVHYNHTFVIIKIMKKIHIILYNF